MNSKQKKQSVCRVILLAATFVFMLITPLRGFAAEQKNDAVSLLLQWTPQAQFAGYLMALEKGFYREHGIDLTIIPGDPDIIVSNELASGKVDFGTMFLATALERRDAGMELVNIGQFIHHSALMLIARADSGINTIQDLDGKKVSLWANEFQIQPRLLFQQAGIKVHIILQAQSMELFLRGAVSATSAMWYNEYHTILSSGWREDELHPFFFKDTEYDFPEDGIYCLEKTLQQHPEAARALLEGTLQGWRYAFAHEEETLDVVSRYMTEAKLPLSRIHQRWMLNRMRDILLKGQAIAENGILNKERFDRVVDNLLEAGTIRHPVVYSDFYKKIR